MAILTISTASGQPSPGHGQAIEVGQLERCTPDGARTRCRPVSVEQIDLAVPIDHLRQTVIVPPSAVASRLPLAVTLIGTMSSEVRWNGRLVGRNGTVGADRYSEMPGQFRATMPVPREVVRPGRNVVDIRMSAHHRWLPVRMPVQQIGIGYYEGSSSGELGAYWPALLTAGALLLAMLYFGVVAVVGRSRRDALILAGVGACASLQLAIETSRSFLDYAYPWHVMRLSAIVVLVAATAALMCAYVARRFLPRRTVLVAGLSLTTSIVAIATLPFFDVKAWACLCVAGLICLVCAASTARHRGDGRVGTVVAAVFTLMLVVWRQDALDRGYYLFMAALLSALVAEQVMRMRHVYSGYESERERSADLATRLGMAESTGKSIISFRDGAVIHRLAEEDIVHITAADDFCEVRLTNRSPLLVGGTMKAITTSLNDRFLRVHKSHIVNLAHVAAMTPRPGGGHQLVLQDGSVMPVGRTYREAVAERLER